MAGNGSGSAAVPELVVVGAGVAGMTAALVAAELGLSVLILEKSKFVGGATAYAAGGAFIPGCDHLPEDDREDVVTYLNACAGGKLDVELVRAMLDAGPRALRFLEQISEARFQGYGGLDYNAEASGARTHRTVTPIPFDGRRLGQSLRRVRPPLPAMTILNGMQVDYADIARLMKATKSVPDALYAAKLMARHMIGKARHGRSPRMVFGNALVGRLFKSVLDRQGSIEIRWEASARELIVKNGRVVAIKYELDGQTKSVLASCGVLLAAGGFSGNDSMRRDRTPFAAQHRSLSPRESSGEGISLALAIGARMSDRTLRDYCYAPVSVAPDGTRGDVLFPHFGMDRCFPGAIAVGADGRRFVNEGAAYSDFVPAMHAAGAVPAFLICDHGFLRKYGFGLVKPAPFRFQHLIRNGYLISGKTIDALARTLGIDESELERTVARNNAFAASGKDLDFGKGDDRFSRSMGDPDHGPNPCLGAIERPPFYAIRLWPGDTTSAAGLDVDASARVLDQKGQAIPGLYAAGPDMANPMLGTNPTGGCNIGPAIVFGYLAAQDLAARRSGSSTKTVAAGMGEAG